MSCQPPVGYADPRDVGQLAEPFRSRIAQLIADAPTGGLVPVSLRRTPWQQWLLRHDRCPGRECDPACKGSPTTALPGRSKHQLGLAADLGGRELAWARSRARAYGLHLPVRNEPWHFEPLELEPTVTVHPWRPPTAPAPAWVPFRPGDTDRTVVARGGPDNEVSELQLRLLALSRRWQQTELRPGPIDGVYGPSSQRAVVAFHRSIVALQRATGQETWPAPDALVGPRKITMLRWWTA